MKPAGSDRRIKGLAIPSPRPTLWAALLFLAHVGAPVIGVLAVADLLLWLVLTKAFGVCYGFGVFRC